jgi:hypothetical protein
MTEGRGMSGKQAESIQHSRSRRQSRTFAMSSSAISLSAGTGWLVANARTTGDWTITAQQTRYCDEDVLILPLMNGLFPSVAMNALERLRAGGVAQMGDHLFKTNR